MYSEFQRGQLYTNNDLSSDTDASLVPVSLYATHQTCGERGSENWIGHQENN